MDVPGVVRLAVARLGAVLLLRPGEGKRSGPQGGAEPATRGACAPHANLDATQVWMRRMIDVEGNEVEGRVDGFACFRGSEAKLSKRKNYA